MGRMRAVCRVAGWVLAAAVVVVCLGWGVNGSRARHAVWGRSAVGVEGGKVVLARCSGAMARQGGAWKLSAGAMVAVGPRSSWLPSTASGSVSVGPSSGPMVTTTLRVLYVPLVFVLPVMAAVSAWLLWLGRRRDTSGHCRVCGYDLAGLGGAGCPECGDGARLWRALSRVLGRRMPGAAWGG